VNNQEGVHQAFRPCESNVPKEDIE
jgi:hypothetical protein